VPAVPIGGAGCHRRTQTSCCALFLPAAIFLSWQLDPAAWGAAFDSLVLPIAGFMFLPWLSIAFVLLAPAGISTGELLLRL
jgi:hypothetical protein